MTDLGVMQVRYGTSPATLVEVGDVLVIDDVDWTITRARRLRLRPHVWSLTVERGPQPRSGAVRRRFWRDPAIAPNPLRTPQTATQGELGRGASILIGVCVVIGLVMLVAEVHGQRVVWP